MVSLILFVILFGSYSSHPNQCGWAIIDDEFQPLDFCQQQQNRDGSISSYMISCNPLNDAIEEKRWLKSETCNIDIESYSLTFHSSIKFNCNDTRCPSSYVTYNAYLTDECLYPKRIITDNIQKDDAQNNEIAPFRETTLITNTCYNDTNTPYHSLITCNNDSYSMHSYHDASCTRLFTTTTIDSNSCNTITYCSHTTTVDIPTTTTAYFTTTQEERCNFINNNGYNVPTDKCMTLSSFESQQYACNKNGDIEWFYYNNYNCDGNELYSYVYPQVAIIDMNCDDATCSDTEYMELVIYKTQDDCGIDAISDTDYDSHVYAVDTCMMTQDGGSAIYQCRNNQDSHDAGYNITYYLDSECLVQANETLVHSEVECIEASQRRQHMVFCNGVNEIIIEQNHSYIMDCNYFINHHMDALGRIGEPLNQCMNMQHAQNMYSKKYQCNATRNGIEEVIYRDVNCRTENVYLTAARPELNTFYCESANDCNSIPNYVTMNDAGEKVTISNYDAVLIGKQYTNDTCVHSEDMNEFWYDQYIIIDECWRIESDLYAVITCDANGFVYHSLYTDDECTPQSLVSDNHRFDAKIDCIYGRLFETLHCPQWITTTQAPIATTTPYVTSTATEIETTEEDISSTIELESTQEESAEETTTLTTAHMTTEATTRSSDVVIPITSETTMVDIDGTEDEFKDEPHKVKKCVNVFGGGDVWGVNCNTWAAIMIVLMFVLVAIIVFGIFYCLCSRDTKAWRKGIFGRQSRLSVANGNNNDDLQDIVVQQLNKGQHIKPAVVKQDPERDDSIDI